MIDVSVSGTGNVVNSIHARINAMDEKIYQAVNRLSLRLLRHVKADKLSGQVLKNRTGRLRRSINRKVTSSENAIIATVGTNVSYAAAHEYGFHGNVSVKAHLRKLTKAFGKAIKNPHQIEVRASTRKMNMPERSFLRSSLKDLAPTIRTELTAAAQRK